MLFCEPFTFLRQMPLEGQPDRSKLNPIALSLSIRAKTSFIWRLFYEVSLSYPGGFLCPHFGTADNELRTEIRRPNRAVDRPAARRHVLKTRFNAPLPRRGPQSDGRQERQGR